MVDQVAAGKPATSPAERSVSAGEGYVRRTVQSAIDVVSRGRVASKAALDAITSPRDGSSPARATASKGLTALREASGHVMGSAGGPGSKRTLRKADIIEDVDIGAPRRLVYTEWSRLREFPSHAEKAKSLDQATDEQPQWKRSASWSSPSWESALIEQIPDERIVWRSHGPTGYVYGAVTFHELSPDLTRLLLVMEYRAVGLFGTAGVLWRARTRRVRGELKRFRRHVMTMTSYTETGGIEDWRGEIRNGEVVRTHEDAIAEDESRGGGGRKRTESGSSTRARKTSGTARSSGAKKSSGRSDSSGTGAKRPSGSTRSSGTKRSSGTRKSTGDEQASGT